MAGPEGVGTGASDRGRAARTQATPRGSCLVNGRASLRGSSPTRPGSHGPLPLYISLRSRNASRDQVNGRKGKTDPGGRPPQDLRRGQRRRREGQRQAPEAGDRGIRRSHGYRIVGEFYDASVSGADPIETRPGFTAMLTYIAENAPCHRRDRQPLRP
jgi:hypothetical protein